MPHRQFVGVHHHARREDQLHVAAAYPQLAGPIGATQSQTFDFGLPYFYGRNIFTAIEGHGAGPSTGPFVAY